ncbi:MAG TPA: polyprenyl diphosphate synthase [Thermoleophilia bacterium]|nr:polyprenyl diphosphate synthase [Thermoleophilia bacterium]
MAPHEPSPRRTTTSFLRKAGTARRLARGAGEQAAGGAQCRYLAVIMDGNGRWARRRHLPVAAGHRAGAKALRRLIERALDRGLAEVTVYSFSSENWRRPADEVAALMELFVEQIGSEVPEVQSRGVRVRFLGRRDGVDDALLARIDAAEAANPPEPAMTMYIAFNYGARDEIVDAARELATTVALEAVARQAGASPADIAGLSRERVTEDALSGRLYAPEMHDPELLIRTSGEERVSNFLLWQLAYSELYFTDKLWPDFGPDDLDEALAVYATRARRFGGR